MTRLSLKLSKLCTLGLCTVIWLGSRPGQLQSSMRTTPNSASRRSCTFASWSNNEKHPSTMKPQDQPATTTTNIATPSKYRTSILMGMGLLKIGKRIAGHPHQKGVTRPSITGQASTTRAGACRAEAVVAVKAHTHSSLCTVCTMAAILTTAQKTTRYSLSPRKRWSKNPTSLRNNRHPGK
jgi:hypothetical protein